MKPFVKLLHILKVMAFVNLIIFFGIICTFSFSINFYCVSVEDIMKHSSSRSSVDLLGAPVPSAIPSPDLHPIAKQLDLMKFENIAGIWKH